MPVPIIRRFSKLAAGVLLIPALMTDDETGLTFIRITRPNAILDIVNTPIAVVAGDFYVVNILKAGIDTGRRIYTIATDPATAGRMSVGPIALSAGDYNFLITQTAGVAAVFAISIKFADTP